MKTARHLGHAARAARAHSRAHTRRAPPPYPLTSRVQRRMKQPVTWDMPLAPYVPDTPCEELSCLKGFVVQVRVLGVGFS
jgi:hypothetical protein